jgi:hypothetical protein
MNVLFFFFALKVLKLSKIHVSNADPAVAKIVHAYKAAKEFAT